MPITADQIKMPPINQIGDLPKPAPVWRKLRDVEALSLVRHIMRERGDCTMVPVVLGGYRQYVPNQWGDSIFIHVMYAKKGYMATYGGVVDQFGRIASIQCYMD